MDSRVQAAKAAIEQFDDSGIHFALLVMTGRVGSQLLHTYLDNHPSLILMPGILHYYFEWSAILGDGEDKAAIADRFLKKRLLQESFDYLGPNHDEKMDFPLDAYREAFIAILESLETVDRKTILLAAHFAYAVVKNQDMSQIKAILLHHHLPLTRYFRLIRNDHKVTLASIYDVELHQVLTDFPRMKWMTCIRNPYDQYARLHGIAPQKHLWMFFRRWYTQLFGTYHALDIQALVGADYFRFVRLEDLHRDFEATMADISRFLNLPDSPALQESTITGKKWWGLYPDKPLYGTNPDFKDNYWIDEMEPRAVALSDPMLSPLARHFGYTLPRHQTPDVNLFWQWPSYEWEAYSQCWKEFWARPLKLGKTFLPWLLRYPFLRAQFIRTFSTYGQWLDGAGPCELNPHAFWFAANKHWMISYREAHRRELVKSH